VSPLHTRAAPLGALLTVDEAAAQLRVHPCTVREILQRGEVPGAWRTRGATGRWRIPAIGLVAYHERMATAAQEARRSALASRELGPVTRAAEKAAEEALRKAKRERLYAIGRAAGLSV
jgi:excisionase family DNA binding protein